MPSNKQQSNTMLTTLFLQSTLSDSLRDYKRSLSLPSFPHWDAIVITASNTFQAMGYERQIEYRKTQGQIPGFTDIVIVPDENNVRVGSGGSTLSVIKVLKKRYGSLNNHRFLCIHAGGSSQRCPQYSALGKLFSPIPTKINNHQATLFDMILLTMASVPGRMKDGMLLLSGDVILLMNPLMIELSSANSSIITFKENVNTGKNHGVCLRNDKTGNVKDFFHKQSVEFLTNRGAVDERGNCNIDTGAVYLGVEILEKLYGLIDTDEKYKSYVNDKVRLSLYGDINFSLSEEATLDLLQKQTPEGDFCNELKEAREKLWNAIGDYSMRCLTLSPAKFVHFGSIPEIMELMNAKVDEYESIGWKRQINSSITNKKVAGYNAVLSSKAKIGTSCYLEVSYVHSNAKIGNNCYISFCDIHNEEIPDNLLVHGLKQNNGKFVCRIMNVNDNPKKNSVFNLKIESIIKELGVSTNDIWDKYDEHTLWNAKIYPECDSIKESVRASLDVYKMMTTGDKSLVNNWLHCSRKSLCSGLMNADSQAIIDWNLRMEDLVKMDEVKKLIFTSKPASGVSSILGTNRLTKIQIQWLENELGKLNTSKLEDFSYAMRLKYYLGVGLGDESYINQCFKLIADTVMNSTLKNLSYNKDAKIVHDETVVQLPLRANWGGGWSDTCPHCLENGGTVLNAAIKLNGEYPVEVKLVKILEKKIVFISNDMGVHGEFDSIEPLQATGDPYDPFALQKACLLACGIIPQVGGNLHTILNRLGGGFEMHSEVTNVPKGSGLGTSSILSAAAVKAMLTFTGIEFTDDTLYSTVLAMEQIMSTGGGWQDQVGGVTPGIKYITSEPGINQQIRVDKINLSEETKKELNERFAIIYTGQRRLARNLLRDVVGRYVGNEPDSIFAHKEIQKYASQMRDALENGNIDEFARLLDDHWRLSQMIDAGSTNSLIDQIFMCIGDMIDAKMCCGAGGGGFLQIILKKGVTKDDVHKRLKDIFQDFTVDVWPSEIVYE